MAHAFNPSTQEAEAGRSLSLRPHNSLESELQDNKGYTKKPCLGRKKRRGKKKGVGRRRKSRRRRIQYILKFEKLYI